MLPDLCITLLATRGIYLGRMWHSRLELSTWFRHRTLRLDSHWGAHFLSRSTKPWVNRQMGNQNL